jgi:hypothetical protein
MRAYIRYLLDKGEQQPTGSSSAKVLGVNPGVRSRMFKLPFEKLNREAGCVLPNCRPPPCDTMMIGARMETLLSVIGPDLVRFESFPRRVDDFARFLGKLIGRAPGREERLAAATGTGDMTMQVVRTHKLMPLRPLVEWFQRVWVPQERRLIADDEARSDLVNNVLCDAFLYRNVDPLTNGNNLLYANTMRTHFFPGCDPAWLCENKFYVFDLPQLLLIIERMTHRKNIYQQVRDAFIKLFSDSEGEAHPNRLRVRMLDFKRKCLSDLYRDNGGELPHESQLEDKLADTPMEVIAVPARVVNKKVGHSDAPPTPEPDHAATITNFIRIIETDGHYPNGRPEMDWVCTAEDVDDVVERCEHTRAIGLAAADFAPLPSALDATDDVTADSIEGVLHADEELLNESELEEDSDSSQEPHASYPTCTPPPNRPFDFRVSQSPSPPSRRAKRVCAKPSPKQPTPSPESSYVVQNRRRRNLNCPVLESPEESQSLPEDTPLPTPPNHTWPEPEQSQLPEPGALELLDTLKEQRVLRCYHDSHRSGQRIRLLHM